MGNADVVIFFGVWAALVVWQVNVWVRGGGDAIGALLALVLGWVWPLFALAFLGIGVSLAIGRVVLCLWASVGGPDPIPAPCAPIAGGRRWAVFRSFRITPKSRHS